MPPSIPDEWRDLLSLIPGYDSFATAEPGDYFDVEQAEFACSFFEECLQLIEGERAGPFILEDWQAAIVGALWGWRRADGIRRYREILLLLPRKSGKSPLCAGLALLSLFTDHEPGAQVILAASSRDQAGLVFRHAAGMIEREPLLREKVKIYRSFKSIEYPEESAILKTVSGESGPAHGLNASCVVIDEIHAHADDELMNTLVTSTASRKNPLIIYATTADYLRPSPCNTLYERACRVRDGQVRDSGFLPVIYEALPTDDWMSEAVWAKCNPNLGVSVKLDYLRRECEKAKQEPSYSHVFKRLHLNIRTGSAVKWIDAEAWDACRAEMPDLSGRVAYAGMDLSSNLDLSAVVLGIPGDEPTDPIWLLPRFFVPEAKLDSKQDKVPYRQWHEAGHIIATPGNVIDYEFIRAEANRLALQFDLQELRFDPWSAQDLATRLSETDGLPLTAMRQGYASMASPVRQFERLVVSGGIRHDGNPVLAWMLGGCRIERDAHDNMKITKRKSTTRVDGIVAAVMAVAGVTSATGPSIYASRGLLSL